MRPTSFLSLAAWIPLLGVGAWVVHRYDAPIRHLEHQAREVRTQAAWWPSVPSPFAPRVQADLADASQLLRPLLLQHDVPAAISNLATGRDSAADRQTARIWLGRAAVALRRVEEILARPEVAAALRNGERLGIETPSLRDARSVTNALCAAAVQDATDGEIAHALIRLERAWDLGHAVDDRSMVSATVRGDLQSIVVSSLRAILERDLIDPGELRAAFEPRLRDPGGAAYRVDVVRHELQRLARYADDLGGFEAEHGGDALALLESLLHFKRVAGRAELDPAQFVARPSVRDPLRPLLRGDPTITALHQELARHALLRVELALHVHRYERGAWPDALAELAPLFVDGVPLDPHTNGPVPFEVVDGEVRLGPTRLGVECTVSG